MRAGVAERRYGNRAENPSGSGEDPAAEGDQTGAAHYRSYRSERSESDIIISLFSAAKFNTLYVLFLCF